MKRIIALGLLLFLTNNFVSCAQEVKTQEPQQITFQFDAQQLLLNVKTLSSDTYEGRRTGTDGAIKAKDYIVKELKKLEVKPLVANFEQPFTFSSRGKNYNGINILGLIDGSETTENYIVISAHYDHEGIKNGKIYNGADDDASGVSALLAFAEYFQTHPPKHSVILAFFDAEELGLKGSKYYVDNPVVAIDNIKLNVNLDMVSRSDKNELYITGARDNKAFETIIQNQKSTDDFKFLMGHDGKDGKQNWTYSSDHGSFFTKGIPFLYFGVEDHKDYHKPTDDFENIHPEFYKNAVENMITIFKQIDVLTL